MRPATLTDAPLPNSTPLGLMIHTRPLAMRLPSIAVTPLSTRFKAMAALLGCTNCKRLPDGTDRLGQFRIAFSVVC